MALPPRCFYSVLETSVRWGCSQTDIIDWAIARELDLVLGVAVVHFEDGPVAGLLSIPGTAVRPLFRPHGDAQKKVYIRRARAAGTEEWNWITKPMQGVKAVAGDIMLTSAEIERFEEVHGIGRRRTAGPGAPGRYDWDGFYVAMMKRIHDQGFPAKQAELIGEMQDWFIANSAAGAAPDESTIRQRVRVVWRALNPG